MLVRLRFQDYLGCLVFGVCAAGSHEVFGGGGGGGDGGGGGGGRQATE